MPIRMISAPPADWPAHLPPIGSGRPPMNAAERGVQRAKEKRRKRPSASPKLAWMARLNPSERRAIYLRETGRA